LLITNAHLLEPATGTITEGWLEIAGGRIVDTGEGTAPSDGDLDAAGATVLPGLIDAHVHLLLTSLDPQDTASWSAGYATVRALREAERMLRRGFTTVRDVGGADYGMARALQEGLALGPRLVFGGKALSQTGGHGDFRRLTDSSIPCCQSHAGFARIADGVDAVRTAARDEFRKGAKHLKVLVSGGVASPHDDLAAVQYSDEELRAAVEEAENHGRYVTAHAYHPRAINRALRAGVRCIEHGNLLDEETLELLVEKDAFLVPTLITYDQLAAFGLHPEKLSLVRDEGLAALEKAHRAGVNLVYGSDLLGPMQPAQLQEFTLRAQVQPPADVLRAATANAARLLGLAGQIGTLAVGAHADLIVVDGNPLDDIRVLTDPDRYLRHVIRGGVTVAPEKGRSV
jgi:imidazolonepropionase-like amidohydrolase